MSKSAVNVLVIMSDVDYFRPVIMAIAWEITTIYERSRTLLTSSYTKARLRDLAKPGLAVGKMCIPVYTVICTV